MLVLSRQRDEAILIGNDIRVIVSDIRGDKVRLGITAPRNVQVHREEVYNAIKKEEPDKLIPEDVELDILRRRCREMEEEIMLLKTKEVSDATETPTKGQEGNKCSMSER